MNIWPGFKRFQDEAELLEEICGIEKLQYFIESNESQGRQPCNYGQKKRIILHQKKSRHIMNLSLNRSIIVGDGMKKMFIILFAIGALSASADTCNVFDYDQYQDRELSRQVKRILKKNGYNVVKDFDQSNLVTGELCSASGEGARCSLVISSRDDGATLTSGEHFEGWRLLEVLSKEIFRSRNYSKIKSCGDLILN
jgi:hypothetical protein